VSTPAAEYERSLPTDVRIDRHERRRAGVQKPRTPTEDVLSLVHFPEFLQGGRARAVKRSFPRFPDVQRVLGDRATVTAGGEAGGTLTFGQFPFLALSLLLLSSLLLVGALLPTGVIARTPVSAASFGRLRQPLAMAAVGILIPLAVGSVVAALS
jgi:hypothetical protein